MNLGPFELDMVVNMDCLEGMKQLPDGCVDLVLTDPPYPKEYLECWDLLSKQSARLLKHGGYCIAYSGQLYMPNVLSKMTQFLTYRWCKALLHKQSHIIWPARTFAEWKPIFIFQNGILDEAKEPIRHDVIYPSGSDKQYHKWGQAVGEACDLIISYSSENDLIIDPFCGGGTVPIACIRTNRHFIGFEIDAGCCAIANKRIEVERQQLRLAL